MRHSLGLICSVLFGAAVLAQAGGPSADPISGTWTGSIGPGITPGYPIALTLKFDGKSVVTGSARGGSAGDTGILKSGVFDPKTGVVKMQFQLADGSTLATFEGTAVLTTMTGRLSLSSEAESGTFILTKSGAPAATAVTTPAPAGSPDINVALQKGFAELSGWLMKSAELVPAEKYSYQPVKTVRTFGQLIAHIADSHNYECARATGRQVQWSDAIEKGRTDKATLVPKLKQSIDACAAAYNAGQPPPPLLANVAHSSLHYGNVVTYLRMLGLTPPSS